MITVVTNYPSGTRRGRMLRRVGTLVALAGLLSAFTAAVTPGAASAGAWVACPAGITEWKPVQGNRAGQRWEGYRYTLHSVTPIFQVSDGRLLDNSGTDLTLTYTLSSSVSRTYSISQTVGVQTNAQGFMTANVSSSIVSSITTAIGVTITTTVPPRTRLVAEYGVESYQVTYAIEAWRTRFIPYNQQPPGSSGQCEEWGYYPQSTVAPTRLEGWRLRTA
nr:hypothetical protein [Micromonospora sp. DSM 115978]